MPQTVHSIECQYTGDKTLEELLLQLFRLYLNRILAEERLPVDTRR